MCVALPTFGGKTPWGSDEFPLGTGLYVLLAKIIVDY